MHKYRNVLAILSWKCDKSSWFHVSPLVQFWHLCATIFVVLRVADQTFPKSLKKTPIQLLFFTMILFPWQRALLTLKFAVGVEPVWSRRAWVVAWWSWDEGRVGAMELPVRGIKWNIQAGCGNYGVLCESVLFIWLVLLTNQISWTFE
jgi:hypothetical protein